MSAQYYRPKKEDYGRSKLIYVTVLVIIIFLLDMVAGGRLRAAVRIPASQIYLSLNHTFESVLMTGLFSRRHILEIENAKLRADLATYKTLDAEYASMRDENARLHTLTSLAARQPGKAAYVVSSLTASAYGTLMIDTGIEEGISRGAVVYTPDGFALGVVTESGNETALVTQAFAPGATTEGLVGETRIVLTGSGGGNARAKAPRESKIAVGDVVRAPKLGAPVGVVEHIVSETTAADQELFVRIPANLQTLSTVYVSGK